MNFGFYELLEHPIMRLLSKIANFVVLNLLVIFFSVPVITIGASFTAAHYTALKLHRGDSKIIANFWKSFCENLGQSTAIWLIFVVYIVTAYLAFITLSNGGEQTAQIMMGALLATGVISLCVMLWVFPVQSKFINPIGKTIRLAFTMTFKHLLRTILMLVVSVFPLIFSIKLFSVVLIFGFSVPIYLSAVIYNKPFKKLEEKILADKGELTEHES
jgi:uncharacterized membrane protein YesL